MTTPISKKETPEKQQSYGGTRDNAQEWGRRTPMPRCESDITKDNAILSPDAITKTNVNEKKGLSSLQSRRKNDEGISIRNPEPIPPPEGSIILTNPDASVAHPEESSDDNEIGCNTSFFDALPKFFMPILLLVTAVLGILITHNIVTFIQTICTLPLSAKILYFIPTAIFLAILFYMLVQICVMMHKLHTFTQVSYKALKELQDRENLRRLCNKKADAAKKRLEDLLKDNEHQTRLIKKYAPELDIKSIKEQLNGAHCTTEEWIKRFVDIYQDRLDYIARKRISYYSWRAAMAATASPFAAFDQLIVLATCVTMLKELFQLYSLKPKWDKNLLLMARIVIQVYLTGYWPPARSWRTPCR